MAVRYVYSGAAGAGTGADWTNAHTSLSAAITASSAGDTFYVAHDHSTNYGSSTTLAFKGTTVSPNLIICVNRAGSVPPVDTDVTTGALEGTNASATSISLTGVFDCEGVTFAPGQGSTGGGSNINLANSSSSIQSFKNCLFYLKDTGSDPAVKLHGGGKSRFSGCTLRYSNAGHTLITANSTGKAIWRGDGTSILHASSTTPNALTGSFIVDLEVSDCDLSTISGTLIGASTTPFGRVRLVNCKLHASVTISGTPGATREVELEGCHSTTNSARAERYLYPGTITTETTIVRTAGASDGTTPFSWKIVPNSNNERTFPIETFEGVIWNDTTGSSKTLTVHTVTDNVTLTDAEIWVEVEYLGSSATPVASFISDEAATILTTAANQASDSGEAWTTTGLTTPLKQKLEVTFTPQMKGRIRWRVKYAKTSTTVYVCPKADVA